MASGKAGYALSASTQYQGLPNETETGDQQALEQTAAGGQSTEAPNPKLHGGAEYAQFIGLGATRSLAGLLDARDLEFGAWCFLGAWSLALGGSFRPSPSPACTSSRSRFGFFSPCLLSSA